MYKVNELTGHQSFEGTFLHEQTRIDVVITESALQFLEDKNMSIYETMADVALGADQYLELPHGTVFAIENPFMNTAHVCSIEADGPYILVNVIKPFDRLREQYRGAKSVFALDGTY